MSLNFLMVQLTYMNLNRAKRLSYISLYDLYGLKKYTSYDIQFTIPTLRDDIQTTGRSPLQRG